MVNYIVDTVLKRFRWGWLFFFIAGLFYFYGYILRVTPSIMSQQLMGVYHLSVRSFGNLSASYYYVYAPMQIIVGLLLDRYGPRYLLSVAIVCCAVGSYVFAHSLHLYVSELGRLLIGFGSAFAFIGVLKLATVWLPRERLAMLAGITTGVGMLGGIFGDQLLTYMLNTYGWKLSCYLLACVGMLLLLVVFLVIPDQNYRFKGDDWHAPPNYDELLATTWQLFKNRHIWINALIGGFLFLPICGFAESWQIPFLINTEHYSQQQAATCASLVFLGFAIGGPIMGWVSDVIRQRRLLLTVGASVATVLFAYVLYVPSVGPRQMMAVLFFYGFFASVESITFVVSYELNGCRYAGVTMGINNMMVMIGGLSVYFIGRVLDSLSGQIMPLYTFPSYTESSYQIAFVLLPLGTLAAVFLTFFLKETGHVMHLAPTVGQQALSQQS